MISSASNSNLPPTLRCGMRCCSAMSYIVRFLQRKRFATSSTLRKRGNPVTGDTFCSKLALTLFVLLRERFCARSKAPVDEASKSILDFDKLGHLLNRLLRGEMESKRA